MTTKVQLLKTLEDLIDKEFEEFKWHLKGESLAGYQSIKASQLENAERQDTMDLIVKTYQLPGAVEATKKLLKTINRNDMLQSLSETSSGPEVDVSADLEASENRGPSSCQTHPLLEVSTISSHSEDNINDKESSENRGPSPFQPLTDNSQSEDMSAKKLFEAELKRVQQYAVDVTLDPDTAHPNLIVSNNCKVNHGQVKKKFPGNPKRIAKYYGVLGKQSFSSGRFYFEVQVKEKTEWIVGVARESINRKGDIIASPQNGFWTIILRNGNEYSACNNHPVDLSLKFRPQKVGVFVDYEEGLVSFYDVDAAALIYSFIGCPFTEKLYPYFNPRNNYGGTNSAPLIICPVNQTA